MVNVKIIGGIVIIIVTLLALYYRKKEKTVKVKSIDDSTTIPPQWKKIVLGLFIIIVDFALWFNTVLIFELNLKEHFWANFIVFAVFVVTLGAAIVLITIGLFDLIRH